MIGFLISEARDYLAYQRKGREVLREMVSPWGVSRFCRDYMHRWDYRRSARWVRKR